MRYTFSKQERLTKKAHFEALFNDGVTLKKFPFSLRFIEAEMPEGITRQVAIVAPKKGLKLAVDRNKVKRQMRELYRLHKHKIKDSESPQAWSIRYLGNRINDYSFLEKAFLELIEAYNHHEKK